jgi:trigger factor
MNESSAPEQIRSAFRIEVEEPEQWKRVIKVEVPRAHFDQQYARRLHRAAQEHVRPGFRKGKTPKAMVEREMGDRLRAEALERIIPEAFKAAIVEHELVPLTDPVVEHLVFEAAAPITFDMTVEVRPKITARDYDDLPLQRRRADVSEAEVDDVLERLHESQAVFERVERPARTADRIVMDLVPVLPDGALDLEHQAEDQKLTLGAANNIEVFEKTLTGSVANQEKQVTVRYPDDHYSESLRGKSMTYLCRVKEVQQKNLPELDDAFAARLSEGGTLLELRQTIRRDLEQEEQRRIGRELEEQIVDALVDRHEIAVPPSLIDQYLKSGLEELHARNTQAGRPSSPEEDEHYRQTTRPIAERIMKGMFIMEAIRRQENIQVSNEDAEEFIAAIAKQNGFDLQKYREYIAHSAERERIENQLLERKTFDFLISRAAIEEIPAAAGGEA